MDKKEYTVLIRQKQDQINKLNKEITKLQVERNQKEDSFTGKYYRGVNSVRWFISDTSLMEVGVSPEENSVFARKTKVQSYHKNLAMDEITEKEFHEAVLDYADKFKDVITTSIDYIYNDIISSLMLDGAKSRNR